MPLPTSLSIGLVSFGETSPLLVENFLRSLPEEFLLHLRGLLLPSPADRSTETQQIRLLSREFGIPIDIAHRKQLVPNSGSTMKIAMEWAQESSFDLLVSTYTNGDVLATDLWSVVSPVARGDADFTTGFPAALGIPPMPDHANMNFQETNRLLNAIVGHRYRDWFCPVRAYSQRALTTIPYRAHSNGPLFAAEFATTAAELNLRTEEIGIRFPRSPAVNVRERLALSRDALAFGIRYRMNKMGFGTDNPIFSSQAYELKDEETSSHETLLAWILNRGSGTVLDVGCSDGAFGAMLERKGFSVTGMDLSIHPGVESRLQSFIQHDLERPLPNEVTKEKFDVIVLADVLEHVTRPDRLLSELAELLTKNGSVYVSVPNIGHWYGRLKIGLGLFSYDRRGLFDEGHVRFFSRVTFRRMVKRLGLKIVREGSTTTPLFNVLARGANETKESRLSRAVRSSAMSLPRFLSRTWPTLFGYQLLFEIRPLKVDDTADLSVTRINP